MRVRKFIARTMPEAMNKIKNELGSDAVIINSKAIRTGGFLGLFRKKRVEVIAALDESVATISPQASKPKERHIPKPAQLTTPSPSNNKEVLAELQLLQDMLAKNSFQSPNNYPPKYEHVYSFLRDQEVKEEIAQKIVNNMIEVAEENEQLTEIKASLAEEIKRLLIVDPGITFTKQIIQFVGPTGVGKTTTLAKVAALAMLQKGKKIAFVTTDTYRIAAIDQLKTYAKILNVPFKVAYSIDDYEQALISFSDYDLIFVDTAGRNFRDAQYVKELSEMIHFNDQRIETYLVLSLTAKSTDIAATYEQFDSVPLEKVIFTKLDETSTYGNILNIMHKSERPIAYITNGQDVPDDILSPTHSLLTELFVSRYSNE